MNCRVLGVHCYNYRYHSKPWIVEYLEFIVTITDITVSHECRVLRVHCYNYRYFNLEGIVGRFTAQSQVRSQTSIHVSKMNWRWCWTLDSTSRRVTSTVIWVLATLISRKWITLMSCINQMNNINELYQSNEWTKEMWDTSNNFIKTFHWNWKVNVWGLSRSYSVTK